MKIEIGNIWDQLHNQTADAIGITTNGFVKSNGECVMGRGIAKEATRLFPTIASVLGKYIYQHGNRPFILGQVKTCSIFSFPVKPISLLVKNEKQVVSHKRDMFKTGMSCPGWACTADLAIIKDSCIKLIEMADKHHWTRVILPKIGCGAGELEWKEVKPILETCLDNRFIIMSFKESDFH